MDNIINAVFFTEKPKSLFSRNDPSDDDNDDDDTTPTVPDPLDDDAWSDRDDDPDDTDPNPPGTWP